MAEEHEDLELDQLREENADLKRQMQLLGDDTEKVMRRRNHTKQKEKKHTKYDDIIKGLPFEVRAAIKSNEDLRREKLKLTAEITHSDTVRRIAELKNQIVIVNLSIEQLSSDIRGMENIGKAQRDVVEMAQHAEEELRLFRSEHRHELNGFKEEMWAIQQDIKLAEKSLVIARHKMHVIIEKLKLNITGAEVRRLKEKTDAQEQELVQLREREGSVMTTVVADQRKEAHEMQGLLKERGDLKRHIEALQETLKERERGLKHSYALSTKPATGRKAAH